MEQICYDLLSREYEKLTWDDITEEVVDLYGEDTLIDLLPEASETNDETKTDAWSFD